jgi:RimJ/RimL family protein N-acetyltransferase
LTRSIAFDPVAGGAVTLRPWEPADVSFVYDACQDADILRWTNLPSPFKAADAIALLHLSTSLREEGKAALFAITSTDQGELLGAASVRDVDHRRRQALVGYWLAFDARHRGVATVAVNALSAWALTTLDLDEVYADVLHGNDASIRVLERCGYEVGYEGSCTQRGLSRPSTRYVRRPG